MSIKKLVVALVVAGVAAVAGVVAFGRTQDSGDQLVARIRQSRAFVPGTSLAERLTVAKSNVRDRRRRHHPRHRAGTIPASN
jgi:hypothetical protein